MVLLPKRGILYSSPETPRAKEGINICKVRGAIHQLLATPSYVTTDASLKAIVFCIDKAININALDIPKESKRNDIYVIISIILSGGVCPLCFFFFFAVFQKLSLL